MHTPRVIDTEEVSGKDIGRADVGLRTGVMACCAHWLICCAYTTSELTNHPGNSTTHHKSASQNTKKRNWVYHHHLGQTMSVNKV